MVDLNRDRERHNDAVYAEHKAAIARGEKRVLRKTETGELHSYPADEIGFSPGRGQVQVRSWWGMGILTTVMSLLVILSLVMLLAPMGRGEPPFWDALFLTALGGFGAFYTFGMARDEYRAKKLRKERQAPEPGAGHVSQ
ncbi:hypothetical protein QFZ36_001345 [Pseudarthrobacter siccitolerans]|uniref:Uncharacterized protein n=1 Tax=Pseudarthrobacter siccitolerans TaxID=861266 RepID=A0ABU0PIJ7_9MICC|nr:hypothetical protein [Pseudarthrobacter siccitolerans]MDQ0673784.1 hypothetical protein [Pseudarthrobacter siccitolerans]